MQPVVLLLLRRMRLPLIILITTYAIAILGFVLIPGIDDQGHPWRMDFFHATYFVSFLGSTIGLGEIPFAFNDAQRMWSTFIIYAVVISWLYAIGAILTMMQDPGFRKVLAFTAFARKVHRFQEPFYLICGYGDASKLLARELSERYIQCVVVDHDEDKILRLNVEDLNQVVPGLCADASSAEALRAAGLDHRHCKAVIALTGDDHVNLTIAITSKLLAPDLPVICQSDAEDTSRNMASFGTDHIIDPYESFADRFAMMFHSPSMYLVYEWMTAVHNAPLTEFTSPPSGNWILCGFGRFGKAVRRQLAIEGVNTTIIEANAQLTAAQDDAIEGRGTEAGTLILAGVNNAVGIIAGTDNDPNNLSILITAHDLNPELFMVGRQNYKNNNAIFQAADVNIIMQPGTITARRILGILLAPLLSDFLRLTRDQDEEWANILVSRVAGVVEETAPETWDVDVGPLTTPAIFDCLIRNETVTLETICTDPRDQSQRLQCIPLLISREDGQLLLPDMDEPLQAGDQLLFCGHEHAAKQMNHLLYDHRAMYYVRTGIDRPSGYLWRRFTRPQN